MRCCDCDARMRVRHDKYGGYVYRYYICRCGQRDMRIN